MEAEFPSLPGHVRIMLPEIRAIAKSADEALLLIELAKSARTRELIGNLFKEEVDIIALARAMQVSTTDQALKKRLSQALQRFERNGRLHSAEGITDK